MTKTILLAITVILCCLGGGVVFHPMDLNAQTLPDIEHPGRLIWGHLAGVRVSCLDNHPGFGPYISQSTCIKTIPSDASEGAHALAVDERTRQVYWAQDSDGNPKKIGERSSIIRRANVDGSGVETVATLPGISVTAIALHGSDTLYLAGTRIHEDPEELYRDEMWESVILKMSSSGGTAVEMYTSGIVKPGYSPARIISGLAVHQESGTLFWVQNRNVPKVVAGLSLDIERFQRSVFRLGPKSAEAEEIIPLIIPLDHSSKSVLFLHDIAIDEVASNIYWTQSTPSYVKSIFQANLKGTNVKSIPISSHPQVNPSGTFNIAVDPVGRKLYWKQATFIKRANLDGSDSVDLLFPGHGNDIAIIPDIDFIIEVKNLLPGQDPSFPHPGQVLTFTAVISPALENRIRSFSWDFDFIRGNQVSRGKALGKIVTHTYRLGGIRPPYVVELTVETIDGEKFVVRKPVELINRCDSEVGSLNVEKIRNDWLLDRFPRGATPKDDGPFELFCVNDPDPDRGFYFGVKVNGIWCALCLFQQGLNAPAKLNSAGLKWVNVDDCPGPRCQLKEKTSCPPNRESWPLCHDDDMDEKQDALVYWYVIRTGHLEIFHKQRGDSNGDGKIDEQDMTEIVNSLSFGKSEIPKDAGKLFDKVDALLNSERQSSSRLIGSEISDLGPNVNLARNCQIKSTGALVQETEYFFDNVLPTLVNLDPDEDGILGPEDNCPVVANVDQTDSDDDGVGNVCEMFDIGMNEPLDIDGDGNADIVWRNINSGVVAVWLMNGTTMASSGFLGGVPAAWQVAGIGDLNGDGKADIIWRSNTGGVAVWLMDGLTITSIGFPGNTSPDWEIEQIGDVDGNGTADLLWRNISSGVVAVWLMNGTRMASSGFLGGVPAVWQIVGIGDVNGDGKADVLWRNNTGVVAVWVMDKFTITSVGFPGSAPSAFAVAGTGDVDGNGTTDVVWRNTGTGGVVVWLMNGTTIAASGFLAGKSLEWEIAQVGDTDGDGKADVIWFNTTTGEVDIWRMNGGSITSTGSPGTTSPDWEIQ